MPSKLTQQTTYTLDIALPTLNVSKTATLSPSQIIEACREVKELYELLADTTGALPLQKRLYTRRAAGDIMNKLLTYAGTHEAFTVRNAAADLNLPIKKLYSSLAALVDQKKLVREQVGLGLGYLYRKAESIAVGNQQKNLKANNPERERMDSR